LVDFVDELGFLDFLLGEDDTNLLLLLLGDTVVELIGNFFESEDSLLSLVFLGDAEVDFFGAIGNDTVDFLTFLSIKASTEYDGLGFFDFLSGDDDIDFLFLLLGDTVIDFSEGLYETHVLSDPSSEVEINFLLSLLDDGGISFLEELVPEEILVKSVCRRFT